MPATLRLPNLPCSLVVTQAFVIMIGRFQLLGGEVLAPDLSTGATVERI
jgi:hypothetical protein